MAYNTAQRFSPPPIYYRFLDPGAYQNTNPPPTHSNKVSFLSKAPRNTYIGQKIWNHKIYYADNPKRIPNCTSLQSKIPRFSYEALSKEDIEDILCRCGLQDPCECPLEEAEPDLTIEETVCQGKIHRRIFKGKTLIPFSDNDDTSKKDVGRNEPDPPFYDTRVHESTAFYQGCKWSKWTSTRAQNLTTDGPGPAEYDLEPKPSLYMICAEKVRAYKRKTCKKMRFLEIIHHQNMIDKRPGPATYSPVIPKGPALQVIGPKADRFPAATYNISPGPADHWIKRDFELPEIPDKWCHANLPPRAPFGVKAVRLKPRREEGPSPASYSIEHRPCIFMRCSTAPFDSSSVRFKETCQNDDEVEFYEDTENSKEQKPNDCGPIPSWQFKSKTIRMKPLTKKYNEPSPADLPQTRTKIQRSINLQYSAPFYSSKRRFLPWYNEIPVHGKEKTPGPAYYCLEKFKCQPAVFRGPLYRTRRFSAPGFQTPAPNEYKVYKGIEDILSTQNQKLRNNIDNQHKFHWEPPQEPIKLTLEEQETKLLEQSISLLEPTNVFENKASKPGSAKPSPSRNSKQKLLRCFVYSKQIQASV